MPCEVVEIPIVSRLQFQSASLSYMGLQRVSRLGQVIDKDSPEPLYRQVAADLRARINSGDITVRLPSLKVIGQDYGVSHITAEKAMDLLKQDGLVVVVVGRGAFVRKNHN